MGFFTIYKDKLILLGFGILIAILIGGFIYIKVQDSQIKVLEDINNELNIKNSFRISK